MSIVSISQAEVTDINLIQLAHNLNERHANVTNQVNILIQALSFLLHFVITC